MSSFAITLLTLLAQGDDSDRARDIAKDILGESRFTSSTSAPSTTPTSLPLRNLDIPQGGPSAPGWISGVMWSVIIALLVIAIAYAIIMILRVKRSPRSTSPSPEASEELDPLTIGDLGVYEDERDIATLLAAATAAFQSGDIALAIRIRFRAGLLQLDDIGALEFTPTLTTRQVSQAIHDPAFPPLGLTFDRAAYSTRESTSEEYLHFAASWEDLVRTGSSP